MRLLLVFMLSAVALIASKLEVTVSIIPQKYFVEKIAKDKVDVNVMVKKGFSPAVYEPKTSQMRKLSHSKAYFSIGVPFEKVWLEKFEHANHDMLIVDTSKGIEKLKMVAHVHHEEKHDDHDDHDEHKDEHKEHGKHDNHDEHDDHKDEHKDEHKKHGKHDDHDDHDEHKDEHKDEHAEHHHEGGLDPHIWLDPVLVKSQAKIILDTLVKLDSKNSSFYHKNYEAFLSQLDELHGTISKTLKGQKGKAFMVFHPSWGYFAKRYNLEQIAVEKEGKEPKPKELKHLIEEAKLHDIKVVFVAPQFSQKAAKVIAKSINGNVVKIDPLSQDYAHNLEDIAKVIKNSYK